MSHRTTARAIATALLAVLVLLAGCTNDDGDAAAPATSDTTPTTTAPATAPADVCDPARPVAAEAPEAKGGTFTFEGAERRYLLHLPPQYDGRAPLPLVFDFHGYGSAAAPQLAYSGIVPVADREGFVVVGPEGQGRPPHFTLLGASATEADDVAFTVALLDDLRARLCLDATRVYATGMSNGGALSSVLACRAADRFAATAAVAALVHLPACASADRAVPFVAFMGTDDPVVPFAGGRVSCCGNPNIPAAPDTVAAFARRYGCGSEPAVERVGTDVEHRRYEGCTAAVEFYVIEGGGHTWPGAVDLGARGLGTTTQTIDATEEIWKFFERHRLESD
jgi:polyhydroxybutyrate depolymerase